MAIDKSKENSRVKELIYTSENALKINITRGIKNPAILKHFLNYHTSVEILSLIIDAKYAMAAGLIDRDDAKWIKEHEEEILSGQSENDGQK